MSETAGSGELQSSNLGTDGELFAADHVLGAAERYSLMLELMVSEAKRLWLYRSQVLGRT